ncbi:spore coat protein GerQ [Marinicrinis lubricantis]|uniref:Spore coat protein GerQ n=1 Tax=Marinicrinis lubricantis TaxID=2086470 RepID=A0ABW1IQW0_9BACL
MYNTYASCLGYHADYDVRYPSYPQTGTAGMMAQTPGFMTSPGAFPGAMVTPQMPSGTAIPGVPGPAGGTQGMLPVEQSYVENILRANLGKKAKFYMTYENNSQWNAKIFVGVIEAAGRDHIIISDPATGKRFLLLTLNLDFVEFDEPLNYTLPFGSAGQTASGR